MYSASYSVFICFCVWDFRNSDMGLLLHYLCLYLDIDYRYI